MAAVGLIPALSLVIGSTLGLNAGLDAWLYASSLPAACACAVASWWRRAPVVFLLTLAMGFLAGGAALAADARERALQPAIRQLLDKQFGGFLIESIGPAGQHDPVLSRLRLVEDAARRAGFVSLRADVVAVRFHGTWETAAGGVAISVNGAAAGDRVTEWRAGRTIETPITFRRPTRYLNAGVPDFERDQAFDGVTLLGTVKSGLLIEVVRNGGLIAEWSADIREHVRRAVRRWIEPHDSISAAIASAVLIGDRTGLPDETRELLQAAGTYHVIAISGGNIAILATAAILALAIVGVRGRPAAVVVIAVLTAYALVVTAGPSVWRATLMAVLYFLARSVDQRSSVWQTTSMAAAVMVVLRPLDIRDAGFILTFGATLALIEGARIGTRLTPKAAALSWITASVFASLAIELALLPVSAVLFSRVTSAGLVLNLLAVPLMGVVQIATLALALADGVPTIAGSAGWIAHMAAHALVGSAGLVTLAPWSVARVPPPAVMVVTVYYTALAAMCLWERRLPRAGATAVWATAALIVTGILDPLVPSSSEVNRALRLTMLDVGQGESILIEMPNGRRLLVDAGGAPFGGSLGIGTRVIAPTLWARGVRSLDAMVITHGDPDHLGGALDVLAGFAPGRVWMGTPVPDHRPTQDLLDAAARLDVPVGLGRAGEIEMDGEVSIRVLHPPPPDWERRRVRNDDSLVLEILYRDVALLLTGDISSDIERQILPHLTRAPMRILKVAHHGSRTSSSQELLTEWRPQLALVSAGRGNTFGHPATEVLRRFEAIGATVLRTDLHGQIGVETDGREVSIRTTGLGAGLPIFVAKARISSPAPTQPPSPRASPH